uniref:hypothetical protein n=1 Tax=Staphylococcus argensis TaxID=1607738 RepID=UPI001C92F3B7
KVEDGRGKEKRKMGKGGKPLKVLMRGSDGKGGMDGKKKEYRVKEGELKAEMNSCERERTERGKGQ